MLKKRFEDGKKFPLHTIPVGEVVMFKLEPYTKQQIKKDPRLAESNDPPLFGVGIVAKHLKKATRVVSCWIEESDFAPDHLDFGPEEKVIWMVEATMPIKRMEDA